MWQYIVGTPVKSADWSVMHIKLIQITNQLQCKVCLNEDRFCNAITVNLCSKW